VPNREPSTEPRVRKWPIILAGLVVLFVAAVVVVSTRLSPYIRSWTVKALRERYESDIAFEKLDVSSVFPVVQVSGEGVTLRHKGRQNAPPLASIRKFSVEGSLLGFLRSPRRFSRLELDGLEVNVTHGQKQEPSADPSEAKKKRRQLYPFVITEVVADGTVLNVFPRRPDKPPHTFNISKLSLHSAGIGRAMSFRATLTNPTPPGLIDSTGKFGPWQAGDPGRTPVSGTYTFRHADLSVFRGIGGTLSSEGKYEGVLDRIEVAGETDTPDFTVAISGNPVDLKAEFIAIVDGRDGDTLLQPVTAHFLSTTLVCKGGVIGKKGVPGKTVSLDVTTSGGRLEDLIRISAKGEKPPVVGDVSLHTKFVVPPGNQAVEEKLRLDGEFQVRQARFTMPEVQQKVEALSRRAQGVKNAPEDETTASDFRGRFTLRNAVMTFSKLTFSVPGALVGLQGSYGLKSEQLDFHGTLRLQAKVSQTTTGIKSFLLKAVDPLFEKKGAGTVLPLNITGTREHPSFKVDIRRAIFKR
jgi:hypothetical protein